MNVAGENAVAGEPRAEGRDRVVEDRFGAVAGCQHSLPMTARENRALAARGEHDEQKGGTRGRGYYKTGALWHCCGDSVQSRAMPRRAGGGRIAMAATLAEKSCTPCRGGIPPLSRAAAEEYHRQAPEWGLLDEATRIERTYRFKNFAEAFSFVERTAAVAEAEGHHPDICFGWGYATVSLRTKKIKGLHENDFIMAAKLDRIANTVEAG